MKLFNTMGRRLEEFQSMEPGKARLYTCGPTVYNFAHIGNFRCYLFEDILRRALEYHGYEVTQVMNLTDVDDKTIRDSRACNMKLADFTAQYKKAFFEDVDTLRIERAAVYPEATMHIPEMIDMIQTLMDKGIAYQSEDKSVYFSIAKFPAYGKLARIDMESQRIGDRVKNDEYSKDSVGDFALWKAWDDKDGDVKWDSPWGPGRPGWHIECCAMSRKYLGETFDLHTGGIDNMFPHHEDEIAQSEAANGCKFVNYWLHCEHLTVNRQKMSKSLGNFYTMRDLLAKGYSGDEIRWALIGTHYRSKLNFDLGSLDQARTALRKFRAIFTRLAALPAGADGVDEAKEIAAKAKQEFADAFADDLNVARGLAAVFMFNREINSALAAGKFAADAGKVLLDQYRDFDRILAALDVDQAINAAQSAADADDTPAEVKDLLEQRTAAKKAKDFAKADAIRDTLKNMGYTVVDTPAGPKAEKIG